MTCCGKSFCRQCIERVKGSNKPCPCCNKGDFNDYPNLGLQQPLYGFKVYCVNKEDGCEWKGELGELDNHLNLNPQDRDDKELEGCEFAEIECSYCSDFIKRNELLHHKNELCDKRYFSCEYCNKYESTYDDVFHNHWPVCGCYPVQCPKDCGAFPRRKDVDSHVQNECPLTVVECDFHYAGCEVRLPRRNMPEHLKDGLVAHFSLLAVSHKRQQKEIKVLTKEVKRLKTQTKQLRLHTQIVPVDFVVENPYTHDIFDPWSSMSYTHYHGYKLSLYFSCVSSCFSFGCYLMPGEFDDLLQWPLEAVMKFKLLIPWHQQEQGDNYELSIEMNHSKQLKDGEDNIIQCGSFTVQQAAVRQYIHNSCFYIKVVAVNLK